MDPILIPIVVAFSASAFVAWVILKDGKSDKGLAVGAAIAVFIVAISITRTFVFNSFGDIPIMLAGGIFPAGFFAGGVYLATDKRSDPKIAALGMFMGIMFLWFIAMGFFAGGSGDYENCHDAGPHGMYTVCE